MRAQATRIGPADTLAYLLEMREQSAYGISDGRCGDSLELTGSEDTDGLMSACRAALYPTERAGRQ